jgi:hypothetical protein
VNKGIKLQFLPGKLGLVWDGVDGTRGWDIFLVLTTGKNEKKADRKGQM